MTVRRRYDAFDRHLDTGDSGEDAELLEFARRAALVASQPVDTGARRQMWATVLETSPAPARLNPSRRAAMVHHRLPAPAVLLFGLVLAIVFALSGIGNSGPEIVTPTVLAEQAATPFSSPVTIVPTSAIDQP
ncbi:MAG: hypothetical protein WKF81_04155 [Thermomicrobiales bacterium]